MTGPLHEAHDESLIALHLKRFSGPLGELPPIPPPPSSQAPSSRTPPPKPALMPKAWLPWGVAGVALLYALTRSPTTTTTASSPMPERPSPSAASTDPETSSSALLAQLLTGAASHATSPATASFPAPNAMSAQDRKALMAKFKGMTAGRRDPFLSLLLSPLPPSVPKLLPALMATPKPPPVPTPVPAPAPQAIRIATPAPSLTARLIGVVEGAEAIGLIEVLRNGTLEKQRIKSGEMLAEGFRVAEIAPFAMVLHTSTHQVVSMPIGHSVSLLPASTSSPEVPWPRKAASRS